MSVRAPSAFKSQGAIYHNYGETKWTNNDLVYCRIPVLLDLNDLHEADIEIYASSKLTIELRTQYRVRFIRHADMRKNKLRKGKSIICYEASNCTNLNGRFALEVKSTGFKYTQKQTLTGHMLCQRGKVY